MTDAEARERLLIAFALNGPILCCAVAMAASRVPPDEFERAAYAMRAEGWVAFSLRGSHGFVLPYLELVRLDLLPRVTKPHGFMDIRPPRPLLRAAPLGQLPL
jgi:hypothetical protein